MCPNFWMTVCTCQLENHAFLTASGLGRNCLRWADRILHISCDTSTAATSKCRSKTKANNAFHFWHLLLPSHYTTLVAHNLPLAHEDTNVILRQKKERMLLTGCSASSSSLRGLVKLVPKMINPVLIPAECKALSRLQQDKHIKQHHHIRDWIRNIINHSSPWSATVNYCKCELI